MKLLFNQNLSPKLVESLKSLFPGSIHVQEAGLDKASDVEVWNYSKIHDFIIISKDADFAERSLIFGFPPFVVWIRKGNCTTSEIFNTLKENIDLIAEFKSLNRSGLLNLY